MGESRARGMDRLPQSRDVEVAHEVVYVQTVSYYVHKLYTQACPKDGA